MYLDIPANPNLAEDCMATFSATGPAVPVRAVRLWRDSVWQWCAVTGWADNGPVPAQWTPIEESGDGPARLLTGGDHGLRLAAIGSPGQVVTWNLADATQWAEGFLICRPDTATG